MEERIISLKKDGVRTINLRKDQKKEGEDLKYIYCGLRWEPALIKEHMVRGTSHIEQQIEYTGNFFQRLFKTGPVKVTDIEVEDSKGYIVPSKELDIDLDASIVMFDENKVEYDLVYYGHQRSDDGSISSLLGDDTTGRSKGCGEDNELIRIELEKVSPRIKYMTVILNVYQHSGRDEKTLVFDHIPSASMNIYSSDVKVDSSTKINQLRMFAEYKIDNNTDFIGKRALVLGTFIRVGKGNSWKFTASGIMTGEKCIRDMINGSVKRALTEL